MKTISFLVSPIALFVHIGVSGCIGDSVVGLSQEATFTLRTNEATQQVSVSYCNTSGLPCPADTTSVTVGDDGKFQWSQEFASQLVGPIAPWEILPIISAADATGREIIVSVNGTDMIIVLDSGTEVTVDGMTLTVVEITRPRRVID